MFWIMSHQGQLSPAASHRPTAVLDPARHATEPSACRSRCPYSPAGHAPDTVPPWKSDLHARPAPPVGESIRGRAWCGAARRPHAAVPAVPRSWTPMSGLAGRASCRARGGSGRAGEGTRVIIMPHGHVLAITQVTGAGPLFEPDTRWATVAAPPVMIAAAVEVTLRYDTPVPVWRRVTTRPAGPGGISSSIRRGCSSG